MTSSIKVHSIAQRRRKRTEPRPQGICTQKFVWIGPAVPEICSRTDRQTHRQTGWSQYSAPLPGRSNKPSMSTWAMLLITAVTKPCSSTPDTLQLSDGDQWLSTELVTLLTQSTARYVEQVVCSGQLSLLPSVRWEINSLASVLCIALANL